MAFRAAFAPTFARKQTPSHLAFMNKYTFLFLALAALAGCNSNNTESRPKNLLSSNDFEQLEGWTADIPLPSLTKEKAHSGSYSIKVGSGIDYSNGFIGTLGSISPIRVSQVLVKAWVFVPSGPTSAALVTQVMDPSVPGAKPVLWEALPLDKEAKTRNEWVQVEKSLTLPANVGPGFKLYVYLWSGNTPNIAYIDDIQILRP